MALRAWFSARRPQCAVALIGAAVLACAPQVAMAQSAVQIVNQELLKITQQTSGMLVAGPPDVALQMALVDNAMFDAVNAASGSHYNSYAYSGGPVTGAAADAAALSAGFSALQGIFGQSVWTSSGNAAQNLIVPNVVVPQLTSDYSSAIAALGAEAGLSAGVSLGAAAANAVLNSSAGAGAAAAMQAGLSTYTPSGSGTVAGVYVPPGARPAMYPTWGGVTPVGTTQAQVQAAAATATLAGVTTTTTDPTVAAGLVQTSIASQAYATDLLTTECSGSGVALPTAVQSVCAAAGIAPQTLAQAQAALFWNDPGTTIQPPGHWLQIVDTVASDANLDLLQQARLSASVSTAMADAGIAAWYDKYTYNLWRPITAIADCSTTSGYSWNTNLSAGSCDRSWSSLIATPPHPDFVAGHPAFSGAAATVLADFFGTDDVLAATGAAGFSSTSNSYCNGGTPGYAGDGVTIISCTLSSATASYAAGVYTTCNAISADTNAADANTAALTIGNNSPLICGITETYSTFSAASSGPLGSEYSRIAGGIHTPTAVEQALTIGNSIGAVDFASNFQLVPEPGSLALLGGFGLGLVGLARRRSAPSPLANSAGPR